MNYITPIKDGDSQSPDIVIADEAHGEIKNEKSMIGKLLAGVKTTSRIALTVSPLSNHLQEYYWAMIDWIQLRHGEPQSSL